MPDQTLLDFDLIYEARRRGLLVPFDEKQLKGASYDLRVGEHAIIVHSVDEGGYERVSLKEAGFILILPGQTATIYSLERLGLEPDMKGRISLRSHWAIKGLYFNGGVVDPGYKGLLFFNMINWGSAPVRIEYGAGLVTLEIVRLGDPSQRVYNDGLPVLDVPEEKLPPLPQRPLNDLGRLQGQIDALLLRVAELESSQKGIH